MSADDGFLARWSRRKAGTKPVASAATATAHAPAPVPGPAPQSPALSPAAAPVDPVGGRTLPPDPIEASPAAGAPEPPPAPAPTLDDVAALAPGEEVSRFVARGVDVAVQRAAVKKLFADPHFNVMDRLDIYIDDYGLPDPIPPAMLRQLNQSKFLRLFEDEEKAEAEAEAEAAAAAAPAGLAARGEAAATPLPPPAAESVPPPALAQDADPAPVAAVPHAPDEDADLQLQRDDDARRERAPERARPERL